MEVQIAVNNRDVRSEVGDKLLSSKSCLSLKVVYNTEFKNIFGSAAEARIRDIIAGADQMFGFQGLSTRISLSVEESKYFYNFYFLSYKNA